MEVKNKRKKLNCEVNDRKISKVGMKMGGRDLMIYIKQGEEWEDFLIRLSKRRQEQEQTHKQ